MLHEFRWWTGLRCLTTARVRLARRDSELCRVDESFGCREANCEIGSIPCFDGNDQQMAPAHLLYVGEVEPDRVVACDSIRFARAIEAKEVHASLCRTLRIIIDRSP